MSSRNKLRAHSPKKSKFRFRPTFILLFFLILISVGVLGAMVLLETEKPLVTLQENIRYLGKTSSISVHVSDRKSGIRSMVVSIEQNGQVKELYTRSFERKTWFYEAGPAEIDAVVEFDSKKTKLKDGEAEFIVNARDFSLKGMFSGNLTTNRFPVVIDTKLPRVSLEHTQRYIRPGGSGIVVYDLSEPVVNHGVEVNGYFFKGYPMADRENRFIAYIGLAWDTEKISSSKVIATDMAGNEGKAVFSMILKKVRYKQDRINVGDDFLNAKIPEFEEHYPEMQGSMLDKYLFANNEVRKRNALSIKELCASPEPNQFWKDRFLRMSGASKAGYADYRTYYYKGKPVDKQVHLGMDIASTANVEIKAANRGKVLFADYLGIYGNTVILDHGQGVFSLYSHLSRIDTSLDEMVDQGTVIARSGATGMAGGDHLHFSMLIDGVFVTPVEWWDQHWIDVNINNVLSQL